jgi:hypothetical protein
MKPFLLGFAILVAVLGACAILGWEAPLIAVAAFGLPLLFVLYLRESGYRRSRDAAPVGHLVLAAALGVGFGVGWALLSGAIVARSYSVGLGEGTSQGHTIIEGLTIPIGDALLMLAPAVVIRLVGPGARDPLNGFVIGTLGAVGFTTASMLTVSTPRFAAGMTAGDRPLSELLADAGIHGIAMPLTAVAVGGLVGAALWFTRRPPLVASVLVALAFYLALGMTQVHPLSDGLHAALHFVVAVLALLALRIGLRRMLPRKAHDDRAATDTPRHPYRRLLVPLCAGIVVAACTAAAVAIVSTPRVAPYVCPPDCGRPPIGEPVQINPWFRSTDNRFLVQYPRAGTAYTVAFDPDGVNINFTAGDTGTLQLFGLPATGRTAQRVAQDLIHHRYPDAVVGYEIPNALVGYQPGYGVVSDVFPQEPSSRYSRLRLVVIVAVKNDYALVAAAIGPFHQFTQDFGNGHPSAVNLQLALDMSKYVNSFIWREPASKH